MDILELSAFTADGKGGNPAGVAFLEMMPDDTEMLRVAADLGYSETAFLLNEGDHWRVRYFAPTIEVPFCGHATIALGAALGMRFGAGVYNLQLNDAAITVEARQDEGGNWTAALQSPETWSEPADNDLVNAVMDEFGLTKENLADGLPVRLAGTATRHLILPLARRKRLSQLGYNFEALRKIMAAHNLTTIAVVQPETPDLFHARNPFAIGGVYEDPATGAAAAAFAGYLRDINWMDAGKITIVQGEDMGRKSLLTAEFGPEKGSSIRISGAVSEIK
ncbi:PhzF family phenazine biosynthesis protein [Aestuariispira ectoiniformans]|uniref:PhzF family phenazine biosynthesis protein n=1 Tax=Aestuariispira ectoiniformans TaxID=2775080 RepID=UPI00223C12FF|nr:PhzF family phenazine biosynthesis protein [Aestuariispira ectoiniformans]